MDKIHIRSNTLTTTYLNTTRYLAKEDFRVLTAVEMGQKNVSVYLGIDVLRLCRCVYPCVCIRMNVCVYLYVCISGGVLLYHDKQEE